MTESISKPVRQIAAISLLGALLTGLWVFAAMPVAAMLENQRIAIGEKREVLGRLIEASHLEQDARTFEERVKALNADTLLLKGKSDPLRMAELQTALTAIANAEGLRLTSTRSLTPRDMNGVRLTGVEAQFQASLEQLQKILIAIENNEPFLYIGALRIGGPAGGSDPKANAPLSVGIEVFGATGPAKG